MRLEWIDDILAVLDSGSLARAAKKRLLTQSAFTRGVRLIEESIGADLFDRRRKPVTLLPGVEALAPELRDLAARLRKLRHNLKGASTRTGGALSFACQHAITTTVSPWTVRAFTASGDASVRVRSCNQEECLMLLLSGEVDFAVMYTLPGEQTSFFERAFADLTLGGDTLIPVCAPSLGHIAGTPRIPGISYPSSVFLGQVFDRSIAPRLKAETQIVTKAETALTLAVYEFALGGIGVAWLPRSTVVEALARWCRWRRTCRCNRSTSELFCASESTGAQSHPAWQDALSRLSLPDYLKPLPGGPTL